MPILSRFARYNLLVLCYTLLVILWGALVRATGAGAGCGSHWPLCNGEVLPRAPAIETQIELSHRLSSSALGVLVIVLVVWALRSYRRGNPIRAGAVAALVFTVLEGLIGAAQVRLELVADNPSLARGAWQAAHLANTFLLTAALTLTLWWACGGAGLSLRGSRTVVALLAGGFAGMLLLGASGAVAALGNLLWPVDSLSAGFAADLSPASSLLLRLRILHPLIAVAVGAYLALSAWVVARLRPERTVKQAARWLAMLYGVQLVAGVANVVLLAPTWMQLLHLLLANGVWIALVLLAAAALARAPLAIPSEQAGYAYAAPARSQR